MEKTKPWLKRMLCFLLVGCILSSSIFVSYSNTLEVCASDDYFETSDLIRAAASIVITVIGIGGAIYTGTLSTEWALTTLIGLWGDTDAILKYVTKNDDGTYTIDEAFIKQVIDSIEDIANSTFNGDDVASMGKGGHTYTVSAWEVQLDGLKRPHLTTYKGSITRSVSPPASNRIAGFLDGSLQAVFFYAYGTGFGTTSIPAAYEEYVNGVLQGTGNRNISAVSTKENTSFQDAGYFVNFPVFTDLDACKNYVLTGEGYKDALNYAEVPPISVGTIPGTWTGGNVTVSQRVLDGIIDKVEELNGTDKDIDEKLQELIDFINGMEDGGTVGDDDPVGGSSWLEKIYNVLLQILDKIKSIRRWVIVDTIIDGADFVEDIIKDVASLMKGLVKDTSSSFAAIMQTVEAVGDALRVKFPFCIPWDVAYLLGLFRATPKTPHYEIPIKYGSGDSVIQIDEVMVIDLEQFEIVSKICRTFLTIIFCKGLLDLTMKIVNMKEQEYDDS